MSSHSQIGRSRLRWNPKGERGTEGLLQALERAPVLQEEQIDRFVLRDLASTDITPNETRILEYLSHGLNAPMIAEITGRTAETIHSQVKDLRAKLNAKTQAHAVALAFRNGLIK